MSIIYNGTEYEGLMRRIRNVNIKKQTEVSDSLIDDLDHIIKRLKRNGYDIDSYEISIKVNEKERKYVRSCPEELMDQFEKDPSQIISEIELDTIIKYYIDNDYSFDDSIIKFFEAFITINHDSIREDFEMEWDIDMNNIENLSKEKICDIVNYELEWMGLEYTMVTQPSIHVI